jgi:hypothetical protein
VLRAKAGSAPSGGPCCSERRALLLSEVNDVPHFCRARAAVRYQRRPPLLPSATSIAAIGVPLCCRPRTTVAASAALLQRAADCATSGDRSCYHGVAALLHGAYCVATMARQRCYKRGEVMLPGVRGGATRGQHRRCKGGGAATPAALHRGSPTMIVADGRPMLTCMEGDAWARRGDKTLHR